MGKLQKELARSFLDFTNKEKEEIGNKIVLSLGGDPTKTVTNLPLRKGTSDGGIDGRIPIFINIVIEKRRGDATLYSFPVKEAANAAFSIKLQKKEFDRDQLNAFVGDMERENIFDGIIITVMPFSRDAKYTMERYNDNGKVRIRSLLLEDLLSKDVELDFELADGSSFTEKFIESLRNS